LLNFLTIITKFRQNFHVDEWITMRILILCLILINMSSCTSYDSTFRNTISSNKLLPQIHTLSLGGANAYLLESKSSLVLVDAGWPGSHEKILSKVKSLDKNLKLIIITHGHIDHYGSAAEVRRLTDCKIAIHKLDEKAMKEGKTLLYTVKPWGIPGSLLLPLGETMSGVEPTQADFTVEENFSLRAYDIDAHVIHTPGHTPGSISVVIPGIGVCVGDLMTTSPFPAGAKFLRQ
jgi:hydroxyacylglutathione hydrolase